MDTLDSTEYHLNEKLKMNPGQIEDGTDFPDLVLAKLIGFFDLEQKKTARLVCHNWRCEAERSLKFNATLSDHTVDTFLSSVKTFDHVRVPFLTKNRNLIEPSLFNGLEIKTDPKVRCMSIQAVKADKWVLFLLDRVKENLEHLEFNICLEQMKNYTVCRLGYEFSFRKLIKLTLICDFSKNSGFDRTEYFLHQAKFPLLETVTIEMSSRRGDRDVKLIQLCIELYRFLLRHSSTLTELHCTFESNISFTRYQAFYSLCVADGRLGNPNEGLENLRTLHFETKRMEMNDFARTIMKGTKKLETFTFIQDNCPFLSDTSVLGPVLERNAETLENVTIESEVFDVVWLKPCLALKNLNVAFTDRGGPQNPIVLPALTHIHVNHLEVCSDDVFNLVVKDLNMKNLQSITFGPGGLLSSPNLLKRLGDVFDHLGHQLTQVCVLLPRFNFDWFKPWMRLESLQLGNKDIFVNLLMKPFVTQHATFLPTLKSFKIYDSRGRGESEKAGIRFLGLKDSLAEIIKNKSQSPEGELRALTIKKLDKDVVKVQIILFGYRRDPNSQMDIKVLKFKEIPNASASETDQYEIIEDRVTRKNLVIE